LPQPTTATLDVRAQTFHPLVRRGLYDDVSRGLCGAISGYNDLAHMPPIRNYLNLVLAGATMRGFLVLTFAPRFGEAITQLASWAAAGQIRTQVDIMEGLERAPEARRRLFTGENIGKQLVKIGDAP